MKTSEVLFDNDVEKKFENMMFSTVSQVELWNKVYQMFF